MDKSVVAIVPAYNEEATIAQVVRVLKSSPFIRDVVVVSDGSTDQTARLAREEGAIVFELPEKGGKGGALVYGLRNTDSTLVGFFDADLLGLTSEHVRLLALPVINGTYKMNVGIRDHGRFLTKCAMQLPLISGIRVMQRDVLESIPIKYVRGYMVESSMNYRCRSRGWSYGAVKLVGLKVVRKFQKVNFVLAVLQYIKMFWQVGKAMVFVRIAKLRGLF